MNDFPTLFGSKTGASGRTVVVGVPYDRGTEAQYAGSASAPQRLRALSSPDQVRMRENGLQDLERRAQILDADSVSDIGDIRFWPHRTDDEYLSFVTDAVRVIASEHKRPLLLGGDHSITLAALRGMKAAGKTVQLVQIDAHHDYEPIVEGHRPTHATFLAFALKEKLVRRVVQTGVRGLGGYLQVLPEEMRIGTPESLSSLLLPGVDVYLTIDTDGFDPSIAGAVAYPEPGGLSFDALSVVLAGIDAARAKIVGADWTEYNPSFDTKNHLTGRMILRGIARILEDMASERGAPTGTQEHR